MSKTHKFYDIKQRLSDLRDTRDTINRTLKNLEKQIYAFEGTYLEETNLYENVTKGWDRYVINNRGKKSVMKSIREFDDKERLFSKSSVTSTKAVLDPENKIRKPNGIIT